MTLEPLRADTVAKIRRNPGPDVSAQLLSSYKLIISLPNGNAVHIGRFSGGILPNIRIFTEEGPAILLSVGSFSEFAIGSAIMIGGEHRNASLFNFGFGPAYSLRKFIPSEEADLASVLPSTGVRIGRGVVVSTGATVLDGARIGDGSVIGANAVVRGTMPGFHICAGVPAKAVKRRFSEAMEILFEETSIERVRAHDLIKVPALSRDLENGVISTAEFLNSLAFMDEEPTIHMNAHIVNGSSLYIIPSQMKYSIGSNSIGVGAIKERLDNYFNQIWSKSEDYVWSPDVFHKLGLS